MAKVGPGVLDLLPKVWGVLADNFVVFTLILQYPVRALAHHFSYKSI